MNTIWDDPARGIACDVSNLCNIILYTFISYAVCRSLQRLSLTILGSAAFFFLYLSVHKIHVLPIESVIQLSGCKKERLVSEPCLLLQLT